MPSGYTYVGKLKNSFICDKRLTAYDIRVYLSLKKWETWGKPVTIETMAKEIKMTRKTFSKSIDNLEALKYISVERNTNWDCNKYSILKKGHANDVPPDGNEIPTTEGKDLPINDGNEIPLLSITSNIPIKKEKKINKKKKARDNSLAVRMIEIFNEVNGKDSGKYTANVTIIELCNKVVKGLAACGVNGEDAVLVKTRFVCENKKRQHDDKDYFWNHNKIATIFAKKNFLSYMEEDEYLANPEESPERIAARKEVSRLLWGDANAE